jgi:hypothetical protein
MISSIFDDLKIEGERNIAVAASDDWRMKCFLFMRPHPRSLSKGEGGRVFVFKLTIELTYRHY